MLLLPVYGLTISSRKFFETLSEFIRALGFSHFGGHDTCLFKRVRTITDTVDLPALTLAASNLGFPGRPSSASLFGPASATLDPEIPTPPASYPYPDYMDDIAYRTALNIDFGPHTATGLHPEFTNAMQPSTYNELLCVYVDDVLGATHHSAELVQVFLRRFGAKVSSSLYLGMDIIQDLLAGTICIGFTTYLNRLKEKYDSISYLAVDICSVVGELLWLSLHVFGT